MDRVTHAVSAAAPSPTPFNSRFSRFVLFRPFVYPNIPPPPSSLCLHSRPFFGFPSRLSPDRYGLCLAASLGSPSPESDPPPPGLDGPLSKIQDRVQIFFAVLFWMSLFFWACAWDGRSGNRPTKRSRFRR